MSDNRKSVMPVRAFHAPAAAAQATATIAAPAAGKVLHVTEIMVTLAAGATAATPLSIVLRDGPATTGTVVKSWSIACPANGFASIFLTGLDIPMTQGNAATLESTAAGAATTVLTVNVEGFVDDVPSARLN